MPSVSFSPAWHCGMALPCIRSGAVVLRGAIDDALRAHPALHARLLDPQGGLRPEVTVFVDGERCRDRTGLQQPLRPDSRVLVLQTLSAARPAAPCLGRWSAQGLPALSLRTSRR